MFEKMKLLVNELDPYIRRGMKLIDSAKKGHAAVHGTAAQKQAKRQTMLSVCKRISIENPRWGITSILEQAQSELGCSVRTIQRNLPGLKDMLRPKSG